MNIYKSSLAIGLGLSILLSACDNIADNPDDRFIPVDRIESTRNVLIQEFSGQRCSNCPDGAASIGNIVKSYGENIVPMTLHPANTIFTKPYNGPTLISEVATEYYAHYNSPKSFPYAVFDGHITANSDKYSKWEDDAKAALAELTPATIELIASFDNASNEVTVNYNVLFSHDYNQPLDIIVWVVESGIVAIQQVGASIDRNYVNNHVLRTSLNGTWGTRLANLDAYSSNKDYKGTIKGILDPTWNPQNCEIVVAVLHPDTKFVEQAAQTHIF